MNGAELRTSAWVLVDGRGRIVEGEEGMLRVFWRLDVATAASTPEWTVKRVMITAVIVADERGGFHEVV